MQGAARRQGPSLAKRRNAADALSRSTPSGRADSGTSLCREPLAVARTAARLASWAASRIGLVAGVKLVLTRPRGSRGAPIMRDKTGTSLRQAAQLELGFQPLLDAGGVTDAVGFARRIEQ